MVCVSNPLSAWNHVSLLVSTYIIEKLGVAGTTTPGLGRILCRAKIEINTLSYMVNQR